MPNYDASFLERGYKRLERADRVVIDSYVRNVTEGINTLRKVRGQKPVGFGRISALELIYKIHTKGFIANDTLRRWASVAN